MRSSNIVASDKYSGQERILHICDQLKAETYINPIGGLNLYSKDLFQSKNIKLNFINSLLSFNVNNENNWELSLSILDLLMKFSKSELEILLNRFNIIEK
jgi:hypothetical protein